MLLAFGLATADDDAAALNPVEPKAVSPCRAIPSRKSGDMPKGRKPIDQSKEYRRAGIDAVRHLLDTGVLNLSEVQSEVRKYGVTKMQELPPDAFVRCVASLTLGRVTSA